MITPRQETRFFCNAIFLIMFTLKLAEAGVVKTWPMWKVCLPLIYSLFAELIISIVKLWALRASKPRSR